ncbi:tripartite tricarboxylate transporter permease [Haladaptatus sp. ZSTT2]|uniref:tripartite tricarboxylate transporter permease n=1 Tax=Haladaptatus sp. ZSTT2 TaxID=3120515 RepID=UPI00300F0C76
MALAGVSVQFASETTLTTLGFVAGGILLGTVSGLIPGLHANNFALLLAAGAPHVPGPPALVGVSMLAAGVVHTFLDVVPALSLGVPDPAFAPGALPGHRLVLAGQGREALRLSALGSGLAVFFALPRALPVTRAMTWGYPIIDAHLWVVLGTIGLALVVGEPTPRRKLWAVVILTASSALGVATLDLPARGLFPTGDLLMPLFAGLFGAPVLLTAMDGAGVPEQATAVVTSSKTLVCGTALAGTLSGAIVGYLPGVSSAIAATAVVPVLPDAERTRGFIVATSGVNTANTIFALFALVSLGTPRTGVLVALDDAGVPLNLPVLLSGITIAAAVGFVLVPRLGDWYLETVGRLDYTLLSLVVLSLLIALAWAFAGLFGVCVLVVATVLGLVPVRVGTRRVHLMGVLLGPLVLRDVCANLLVCW